MPERKPKLSLKQLEIQKFVLEGENKLNEMEAALENARNSFWEKEARAQNACANIGHMWSSRKRYDEGFPYTDYFCIVCNIGANSHNQKIKDKLYTSTVLKKAVKFVFPKRK